VAKQLDFVGDNSTALHTINSDVAQATANKIRDFLPFIDPRTKLVLINAVHFKAQWSKQFSRASTMTKAHFRKSSKAVITVPIMRFSEHKCPFYYDLTNKTRAIRLEYKPKPADGGWTEASASMVFILPHQSVPIAAFIKQGLTSLLLSNILAKLDYSNSSLVNIFLPRFKFTSNVIPLIPAQNLRH